MHLLTNSNKITVNTQSQMKYAMFNNIQMQVG